MNIKSESDCGLVADYFTREACYVLVSTNTATITATAVSVTVLIVALGLFCYIRRFKKSYRSLNGQDKSTVPVYLRVIDRDSGP